MIDLNGIDVWYGEEKAVDGVSLHIDRNSTCAIIGPSGCGKTTILYTLAGLVKPACGTVCIDGEEVRSVRRNTGLILQNYGLLPWKTVWDNIAFPLKSRGFSKLDIKKNVESILSQLDILQYAGKYPDELSGGQRQRVAIGRTLALKPDLLLMDEASSALDAMTKENLQNLVLDIFLREKLTLLLVTHNIEEAVFLGQKIVVMKKGKIVNTIENPCFGSRELRDQLIFYETCLKVRKMLYE